MQSALFLDRVGRRRLPATPRRVLDQPHQVRREFVLDPVEYVNPKTLKRVTATARPGGNAGRPEPSRARAGGAGRKEPSRPRAGKAGRQEPSRRAGKAGRQEAARSQAGTFLPAEVVNRIFEQLAATRKPSGAASATRRV